MEPDFGLFSKNQELYNKDAAALAALKHIWRNSGRLPNGEFVPIDQTLKIDRIHTQTMRDTFTTDYPALTDRVIIDVAYEAIEPTAVLAPYLPTVKVNRPGGIVAVPSWGGLSAGDVPPGGEYPGRNLDFAGTVKATVGKVGLKCPLSEEMVRYNEYDVMRMHIGAASRAMQRRKEQKIADAMNQYGTVIFDNASTSYESTEGRNPAGHFNGTVTLEDFFRAHEVMSSNGFSPNTLILHPNAWMIFAVESIARLFGLQRGAGWAFDQNQDTRGTNQDRATVVPTTFPSDWNIVVTPYLNYSTAGAFVGGGEWPLTDIIMCDANAVGAIFDNGDGLKTEEIRDPERDIINVKFKEEYGVSILNEGKGIGLLKNVSVGRGIDFWENTQYTLTSLGASLTGTIGTSVVTGMK